MIHLAWDGHWNLDDSQQEYYQHTDGCGTSVNSYLITAWSTIIYDISYPINSVEDMETQFTVTHMVGCDLMNCVHPIVYSIITDFSVIWKGIFINEAQIMKRFETLSTLHYANNKYMHSVLRAEQGSDYLSNDELAYQRDSSKYCKIQSEKCSKNVQLCIFVGMGIICNWNSHQWIHTDLLGIPVKLAYWVFF